MKMKLLLVLTTATVALGGTSKKFRKIYDGHLREHDLERPKQSYARGLKGLKPIVPKKGLDFDGWVDLNPGWTDGSAFDVIDKDNDGVLWFQEMNAFADFAKGHPDLDFMRRPHKMNAEVTQDAVETFLQKANPSGPGLYATKQQMGQWRAQQTFAAYDADGDRRISRQEMANVLYHPDVLKHFKRMQSERTNGHKRKMFVRTTKEIRENTKPFCKFHCDKRRSKLEKEADSIRRRMWGASEVTDRAVSAAEQAGCQYVSGSKDMCDTAGNMIATAVDCVDGSYMSCASGVIHGAESIS